MSESVDLKLDQRFAELLDAAVRPWRSQSSLSQPLCATRDRTHSIAFLAPPRVHSCIQHA